MSTASIINSAEVGIFSVSEKLKSVGIRILEAKKKRAMEIQKLAF